MTTTCRAMLARMLEADLGDLTGRGDDALAMHVRECVTCRAVADRLARDTELLARSIRSAYRTSDVAERSRFTVAHRVPTAALILVMFSLTVPVPPACVTASIQPRSNWSATEFPGRAH